MNFIADAAAAGGTSMNEMGSIVGSLYQDLQNGRPIHSQVEQLRELGVISTEASNRLRVLSTSGAGSAKVWEAIRGEIAKTSGSSRALGNELKGLQARLENAQADQAKTIGAQFEDGEKVGIESAIRSTEQMTQVLGPVASIVGTVWSSFQKAKAAILEFALSIPGVRGGLVGLLTGFIALIAVLATFSVAGIIGSIVALTASLAGWAAAAGTAAGATTILGRSLLSLAGILRFTLGPWGLLIAALTAIGGQFAKPAIEAKMFGEAQENLRKEVEATNQALKDQIKSIDTQADKTGAIAGADKNVLEAEKNLADAKKDQGEKASDWNPFNDASAQDAVEQREKELADARATAAAARQAPTDAAVESLMGPEFQSIAERQRRDQPEYDAKLSKLQEQRAAAEELETAQRGRGGVANTATIEAAQAKVNSLGVAGQSSDQIAQKISELTSSRAAAFSPENLDKEFTRGQAKKTTQVKLMRTMARHSGDQELSDRADALEDETYKAGRKKELLSQGFDADEAEKLAQADTLTNAISRDSGGTPEGSSMMKIGGSGGYAGMVGGEEKTVQHLKSIEGLLKSLGGKVDQGVNNHNSDEHYQ